MASESVKDVFPKCVSGTEGSGGPVYLDMNYSSPFVPETEEEILEMLSVVLNVDENDLDLVLDLVAVELDDDGIVVRVLILFPTPDSAEPFKTAVDKCINNKGDNQSP